MHRPVTISRKPAEQAVHHPERTSVEEQFDA